MSGVTTRLVRLGTVLAAALLAGGIAASPAFALPPDGAGADTPGTSASVSPTSLTAGATLAFTLSGFPAGETVYVKIDDGVGYGDASVQGSGVVHQQAVPSSGTVSGSFQLPAGITAGAHWLRFLASKELTDANGAYLGVEGYTHRGGTDFTVVAATGGGGAAAGGGAASGSGGTGGGGAATGTTAGSGATSVTGQGAVVQVQPGAAPAGEADAPPAPEAAATPGASGSSAPSATTSPSPTARPTTVTAADDDSDGGAGRVPVVGLVVAGVLVIGGVGVTVRLLKPRGRATGSTPAPTTRPAE